MRRADFIIKTVSIFVSLSLLPLCSSFSYLLDCNKGAYWNNKDNKRHFFCSFAAKMGFDPLDGTQWALVTQSTLLQEKVRARSLYLSLSLSLFILLFLLHSYLFSPSSSSFIREDMKGLWLQRCGTSSLMLPLQKVPSDFIFSLSFFAPFSSPF